MKRLVWAAVACALLATAARAQDTPTADVAAGFANLTIVKGIPPNASGASGSVAVNVNDWLGLAWDLGVYDSSPSHGNFTAETYTVGPRFSLRAFERVTPFAQILFGGSNFSGSFSGVANSSGRHVTFGLGGGTDIGIGSGRVALRPEVDYFGLRVNGSTIGSVRLGIGVAFRIGKKK